MFSSQNGAESGRVSERVTKKLLQIKDTLEIVIENYEETNKLAIKGIEINPITKSRIDKWEIPVRKLAHYGLFLCGGFLIYILIAYGIGIKRNRELISVFLGMLLACTDEFHQVYTANRSPKMLDVGIDTFGVITGVMIATFCCYIVSDFEKRWKIFKS